MESGVATTDLSEEIVGTNVSELDGTDTSKADDGVDYDRLFTFTHPNGEVLAGTIDDIRAGCIGIGMLSVEQAFRVAVMYDRGSAPAKKENELKPKELHEEDPEL